MRMLVVVALCFLNLTLLLRTLRESRSSQGAAALLQKVDYSGHIDTQRRGVLLSEGLALRPLLERCFYGSTAREMIKL